MIKNNGNKSDNPISRFSTSHMVAKWQQLKFYPHNSLTVN